MQTGNLSNVHLSITEAVVLEVAALSITDSASYKSASETPKPESEPNEAHGQIVIATYLL